jgi:hypothetical protein
MVFDVSSASTKTSTLTPFTFEIGPDNGYSESYTHMLLLTPHALAILCIIVFSVIRLYFSAKNESNGSDGKIFGHKNFEFLRSKKITNHVTSKPGLTNNHNSNQAHENLSSSKSLDIHRSRRKVANSAITVSTADSGESYANASEGKNFEIIYRHKSKKIASAKSRKF